MNGKAPTGVFFAIAFAVRQTTVSTAYVVDSPVQTRRSPVAVDTLHGMFERPTYVSSVADLLRDHGAPLAGCVGKRIDAIWGAWDRSVDQWFPDEAVVFVVGGQQLEVACFKMDEISVTWGAIDLKRSPGFVADWGKGDLDLIWRRNPLPELEAATNRMITGVWVSEFYFVLGDRSPGGVAQDISDGRGAWMLFGIEFELEDGFIEIFNALDENGVRDTRLLAPDIRRTAVAPTASR